jgi:hypothetical protein
LLWSRQRSFSKLVICTPVPCLNMCCPSGRASIVLGACSATYCCPIIVHGSKFWYLYMLPFLWYCLYAAALLTFRSTCWSSSSLMERLVRHVKEHVFLCTDPSWQRRHQGDRLLPQIS